MSCCTLVYKVIDSFYEAYKVLGLGLDEEMYCSLLTKEFSLKGLSFLRCNDLKTNYNNEIFMSGFIIDERIMALIKSRPSIPEKFEAWLFNYFKTGKYPLCFLVNFGANKLDIKYRVYRPQVELGLSIAGG
ncbi:MAG: GxxExxY protein [Candidatus Omnitrophica bacterium]|nr:GxxExxY protein [Candidatus Omnitrophota bacterium]